MDYMILNNGVRMPILGFGVFQVEDQAVCERCVSDAIEAGYRSIDTAAVYLNEKAVGRAVRHSGIPREEFFLTSKLWIKDMGYEKAKSAFGRTLERLDTDYLDLYLLHMPFGDVYGAWRALEELYREGRVRAVGVCNFSIPRLADLIVNNEVVPMVNQIETHLFTQQKEQAQYLKQNGIRHEAWAPFAEGRNGFFRHELLQKLADKYGKTAGQIALRWLTQRGIAVIPKSVHQERIAENFNCLDFRLAEEDMRQLAACDTGRPVIGDFDDPEFIRDLCTRNYDF